MAEQLSREQRLNRANQLIGVIANYGRRFFYHEGRIGRFELGDRGRVWWIDAYSQARIYTHYRGPWRRFTGGGTLKALICNLRDYITKGTPLPPHTLGPWPDWYCGGDLWGYGDDMAHVREAASELGLIPALAAVGQQGEPEGEVRDD